MCSGRVVALYAGAMTHAQYKVYGYIRAGMLTQARIHVKATRIRTRARPRAPRCTRAARYATPERQLVVVSILGEEACRRYERTAPIREFGDPNNVVEVSICEKLPRKPNRHM